MIKSSEIRIKFLNFFKKNNHQILESSPLIPSEDATLLFTNAGMVQFKNYFTGKDLPKFENVSTSQKCIRAGGKHNDLDNVGFTPRHHTFFEMLGNFSFGFYFKDQAINLAWDFLINECSLNPKQLVITVYSEDEESFKIWKKKLKNSPTKLIKISSNDNFWSMGETGPCGPCSEIFFDNGEKFSGGLPGSKNQDGDRFIEIWNLVFMEYEKTSNKLLSLPKKCVDTGMGLERITAVLNELDNNFKTDLFYETILELQDLSKVKLNEKNKFSFRIIADHIRSIVFLMSEGLLPSNEGRGYVLRRIIRRASRHLHLIGMKEPLLYKLVKIVYLKYKNIYFNSENNEEFIKQTLKSEETKFSSTLNDGLKLLDNELNNIKNRKFPVETVFKLYDTFGFPIDMTKNILNEKKINFDEKKLSDLIFKQKKDSQRTWKGTGNNLRNDFFKKNNNKISDTEFVGYESFSEFSELKVIIENEKLIKQSKCINGTILIFEKTPFYAESGGQVGDVGEVICSQDHEKICDVIDTKKEGNIYLHFIENAKRELLVGKNYRLKINSETRKLANNNHTSTHILHESLRTVLGNHVKQKGSLVSPEKLRFDYTHNKPMNEQEIIEVEKLINKVIRLNLKVSIDFKSYKEAISKGAIGLFGEKYPTKVRVVTFQNTNKVERFFSSELCGGTHVCSTGEIGSFKIINEISVSSGVRRIEALTGDKLEKYYKKQLDLISKIKTKLKTTDEHVIEKLTTLINENKTLKSQSQKKKVEIFDKNCLFPIKNKNVYCQNLNLELKDIKIFADKIKKRLNSCAIILVTKKKHKISFLISLTNDFVTKLDAVKIVKEISKILDGKGGGGRKDLAQGGGVNINKIDHAFKYFKNLINLNF